MDDNRIRSAQTRGPQSQQFPEFRALFSLESTYVNRIENDYLSESLCTAVFPHNEALWTFSVYTYSEDSQLTALLGIFHLNPVDSSDWLVPILASLLPLDMSISCFRRRSNRPSMVAASLHLPGSKVLFRLSVYRGAIRSEKFREEFHRSVQIELCKR